MKGPKDLQVDSIKHKQKFDDFEYPTTESYKNVELSEGGIDGLRIRQLTMGDAPRLVALRRRAITECAWNFGTPPALEFARGTPYYRGQLCAARMGGSTQYLGLWRAEALCGLAGLRFRRTRGAPFGLVFSMYLVPELRGRRLGRALLRAAQHRIGCLWNPPRLRMHVETRNLPALHLYQSEGFRILRTETAAFHIHGIDYDVYLLEKDFEGTPAVRAGERGGGD